MLTSILSLTFLLLLVLDPLKLMQRLQPLLPESPCACTARKLILREVAIATLLMLGFHGLGDWLLAALHLHPASAALGAGVILFLIALGMIFPHLAMQETPIASQTPRIGVPIATPLIASPTVLVMVMVAAHRDPCSCHLNGAILLTMFLLIPILFFGKTLLSKIGTKGLVAAERIMGLLLTLVAVQIFLEGLAHFIHKGGV